MDRDRIVIWIAVIWWILTSTQQQGLASLPPSLPVCVRVCVWVGVFVCVSLCTCAGSPSSCVEVLPLGTGGSEGIPVH